MKTKLIPLLTLVLASRAWAQVEVLPPDFTLFGKTSGEYLVELHQYIDVLSTNGDYLLPKAVRSATEPVCFLQRPFFGVAPPGGVQTYFIPDDVYVYFPIAHYAFDNIGNVPPWTIEQLRDALASVVDKFTAVHATIDGVVLPNLLTYRTESPVFATFYPTNDNIITVLWGQPFEGWDDPVVGAGFLLMLKPLPAGVHDFQTGADLGGVLNLAFERHFQIHSLAPPDWLAHETEALAGLVTDSSLSPRRQRHFLHELVDAEKAFQRNHLRHGSQQLEEFQKKVRHELAWSDAPLAVQLIESAQRIIDLAASHLKDRRHEQ